MNETFFYQLLLYSWLCLAVVVFVLLLFFNAPYGRHFSAGWGPCIRSKYGWLIMEAISSLAFIGLFIAGGRIELVPVVFLLMWQAHYVHRAFIYPFSIKNANRLMPVAVVMMGSVFNLLNAYLNGRYVFSLSGGYGPEWLLDPRFISGFVLFGIGFIVNRQADQALIDLRSGRENGYYLPSGGLFNYVSCPNYLGEIMIWAGWALSTWSLAGLAFLVWTVANLAPRALAHHKWYFNRFPDYPAKRKILLPFIW